jgi:hypothetical protein
MFPTDISAGISGSAWLLLAALLICVGAAWFFYRYTLPALPPKRRLLMSSLRALTLTLLALLLFEPILRLVSRSALPASVAVLIDDSQSMAIRDRSGARDERLREWIRSGPLGDLPGNVRLAYYRFSHNATPVSSANPADSMEFKGETTDMAAAVEKARIDAPAENFRAVVLVSDGNYTIGRSPVYGAEALGLPVYTVGVGDTAEQKDLLVSRALTKDIAYAGTNLPFDVLVKSSGFGGEKVEVTLSEGTTVVDRKLITLERGVREYRLQMSAMPAGEGSKKYSVAVSQLPGELTTRNNSQSLFVKVLKSKLNILLLAGAPGPDVTTVRQLLVEDPHFSVSAFIQRQGGTFYGGTLEGKTLDSADCLVLVNFPTGYTPGQTLQQIRELFERSKKPLFFLAGPAVDEAKLNAISGVLPFSIGAVGPLEMMVVPSIPERFRMNPLIHLADDITEAEWRRLPPLFVRQSVVRAKPESEVLAAMVFQNVQMNDPLVAVRNVNRQKSVGISGYGLWRWQLLTQGSRDGSKLVAAFLTSSVRWLTTQEEKKNVHVTPVKERFSSSEPVEFTAQVYDSQLRPAEHADMTLELKKGKEVYRLAFDDIGNGRYEGSLQGVPEGDYTYEARASVAGQALGEDRGAISVGQINVEFLETRMNKQLLEHIAFRTGGEYMDIGESGDLAKRIAASANLNDREQVRTAEIEIWNWNYMVPIILFFLSLEWFLRKRMGML